MTTMTMNEQHDDATKASLALLQDDIDEANKRTKHEGRVLRDLTLDKHREDLARKNISINAFENDVQTLVRLQRSYVDFFDYDDEAQQFIITGLLRDFCFRANGQIEWLDQRISQVVAELRICEREYGGSEIQTRNIEKKIDFMSRLERQQQLWQVILTAAQRNYKDVTGETWVVPTNGGAGNKTETDAKARLDAVLARFGNRKV